MVHLPAEIIEEIACPRGDRWMEFAAALNSLAHFAGDEGEREYSKARDRQRKQREQAASRQRRYRANKAA